MNLIFPRIPVFTIFYATKSKISILILRSSRQHRIKPLNGTGGLLHSTITVQTQLKFEL